MNEYFLWMNILILFLNWIMNWIVFFALFNVWMNNQNLSPRATTDGCYDDFDVVRDEVENYSSQWLAVMMTVLTKETNNIINDGDGKVWVKLLRLCQINVQCCCFWWRWLNRHDTKKAAITQVYKYCREILCWSNSEFLQWRIGCNIEYWIEGGKSIWSWWWL